MTRICERLKADALERLGFKGDVVGSALSDEAAAIISRLVEALDSALDFVVDVINEATPGSIHHTNAVECHRIGKEALSLVASPLDEENT